jgi:hypothetical protein
MSNLAARLRAGPCSGDPVFEEAADELDRLEAEIERIKRELWDARDDLRVARGLPLEGDP